MAITLRALSTASRTGGPTSITLDKPTGTVDDDVMLVVIQGDGGSSSPPAGWTAVQQLQSGDSDQFLDVYYKVAASEGADYDFDLSGVFESEAAILTYSDVDTISPINASSKRAGGSDEADPQTVIATAIVPNVDNCMIVYFGGVDLTNTATSTWTPPSGYTERVDQSNNGGLCPLNVSELLQTTAADTGAVSAICDNNNSRTGETLAIILALTPVGGGPAEQTVSPGGQGSAVAYGSQSISNVSAQPLSPGGVGNISVYGSHSIGDVSLSISPNGQDSAAVYGDHLFTGTNQDIVPAGQGSASVYGTQAIQNTTELITPSGLASAAVFGSVVLVKDIPSQGIDSAAVYGNTVLLLELDQVVIVPNKTTASVYGNNTISTVAADTLSPTGIDSASVYGNNVIDNILEVISPLGVPSGYRPGRHTLIGGVAPLFEEHNIYRPIEDIINKKIIKSITDVDGDQH